MFTESGKFLCLSRLSESSMHTETETQTLVDRCREYKHNKSVNSVNTRGDSAAVTLTDTIISCCSLLNG